MALLNFNKEPGDKFTAPEFMAFQSAVNTAYEEAQLITHSFDKVYFKEGEPIIENGHTIRTITLIAAPPGEGGGEMTRDQILTVLGMAPEQGVPESALPPVYFEGFLGTGEVADKYRIDIGGLFMTWAKTLPGYMEGEEKLFSGGLGFKWVDRQNSATEQIEKPSLVLSGMTANTITATWNKPTGMQNATLQIGLRPDFSDANTVYTGGLLTFVIKDLIPSTTYYSRVKGSGSGYLPSEWTTAAAATASDGMDLFGGLYPTGAWDIWKFTFSGDADATMTSTDANAQAVANGYGLSPGVEGAVEFEPINGGMALFDYNLTEVAGRNDAIFGVDVNPVNKKAQAFSKTQGEGESTPLVAGDKITVKFTTTGGTGNAGEVQFFLNKNAVPYKKFNREAGTYSLKMYAYDAGVIIKNIKMKGWVK